MYDKQISTVEASLQSLDTSVDVETTLQVSDERTMHFREVSFCSVRNSSMIVVTFSHRTWISFMPLQPDSITMRFSSSLAISNMNIIQTWLVSMFYVLTC